MRVLVTGANGFVGSALTRVLAARGADLRLAVRRPDSPVPVPVQRAEVVAVGDVGPATDWAAAVDGVDTVVHLVARAHVLDDRAADPEAGYQRINVGGTERLCAAARAAGVRRLVYMSTVKVNGEGTPAGRPYRETDAPAPRDAYGRSKLAAEQVVRASGLEFVILRPPLVYGPGVRANFERLVRWVASGRPLPLGSVTNARSMVYVGNLVDATIRAAEHPAAAGETFLVSDGRDLSTAELIRLIAAAMGRPARLVPFPPALLRAAGRLTGRTAIVDRIAGTLQIDPARIRRVIDWAAPYSVEQGIEATVHAWQP